jgi:uncharacterized protein YukE
MRSTQTDQLIPEPSEPRAQARGHFQARRRNLDLGSPRPNAIRLHAATILALAGLAGCSNMYYSAMEFAGTPKRDLLTKRVGAARKSQAAAKETFESALDQFRAVVNVEGGELAREYDRLNAQYKRCESRATDVSKRIDAVESVSAALFKEWERELKEYQDASLRARSEAKLRDTRQRYDQLVATMHRAEDKMAPVLSAFRERVLFLKHNLNAAAVASLQGEVVTIEGNVADLVAEMEQAIREADAFVAEMDG